MLKIYHILHIVANFVGADDVHNILHIFGADDVHNIMHIFGADDVHNKSKNTRYHVHVINIFNE